MRQARCPLACGDAHLESREPRQPLSLKTCSFATSISRVETDTPRRTSCTVTWSCSPISI
eukprot:scaffold2019_cov26-Tisochrysis_lutea.AAC.2